MSAFVLVTTGRPDDDAPVAPAQVFEKLMLLHLSEGFWPHDVRGLRGRLLEPDDVVLLCLVGEGGVEVVGDAVVAARSVPLSAEHLGRVHMYLGHVLPGEPGPFTHAVTLAEVSIWDDVRRCGQDDPPTVDVLAAVEAAGHTGAVRPIGTEVYARFAGRSVPEGVGAPPPDDLPPEFAPAPAGECGARAFILANWELVDFGAALRPVEGTGVGAIETPAGPIDMILEGEGPDDIVAVMWADGEPPDEFLAAVRERLAWLRANMGHDSRRVRGLILTLDSRHDLTLAEEDLDVRRLRILCEPVRPARPFVPDPLAIVANIAAPSILVRGAREPVPVTPNGAPVPELPLDFAAKCLRVPRARG